MFKLLIIIGIVFIVKCLLIGCISRLLRLRSKKINCDTNISSSSLFPEKGHNKTFEAETIGDNSPIIQIDSAKDEI